MAYIDPEGLFNGDRMAMLSDEARLMWPYFWCASNSLGRLELNYRKVVGRAFHHFRNPPSEQRFWELAREYRDCYLLFIYKHEGSVWGQWDAPERLLSSRYKTEADKRTPAPDYILLMEWKNLYIAAKQALHAENSDNLNLDNLCGKILAGLETFAENSPIGSGRGRDLDKETKPPNPPCGGPSVSPPVIVERRSQKRADKRTIAQIETALGVTRLAWWVEWWSIYPCHEDKRSAMDAFERTVKTPETWGKVRAGAVRYRSKTDANPDLALKYGQGWINGERWEDDGEATRARASPNAISKNDRAVGILMENLKIEGKL